MRRWVLLVAASAVVVGGGGAPVKALVVVEENHSQSSVSSGMPYLASLADTYGQTSAYQAVAHPSLPNHLAIIAGSTFGVTDDRPPADHPVPGASLLDLAIAKAATAKAYIEDMPGPCTLVSSGDYAVKHNPWAYFADPTDRRNCQNFDLPAGTPTGGADVVHGGRDDRGQHGVVAGVVVFVEGDHDRQVPGPVIGALHQDGQPLLQPGISGPEGAVVRVVTQVRDQQPDSGQRAGLHVVVQRAAGRSACRYVEVLAVAAVGLVGEIGPRVVFDGVVTAGDQRARAGHVLDVGLGRRGLGDRQVQHAGTGNGMVGGWLVVGDPEGGSADDGQVVRQRGVRDRLVRPGLTVGVGQRRQIRHAAQHGGLGVVLLHHHQRLYRNSTRGGGCRGR